MYAGGGDKLCNRPFSQLLALRDLDLDFGSGSRSYCCTSLSSTIYVPNFIKIGRCLQNSFLKGGPSYIIFQGHLSPNEDKYQQSVREKKIRYCFRVS